MLPISQAAVDKLNSLYRTEPILNPEFNIELGGIPLGSYLMLLVEQVNNMSSVDVDEAKRYALMVGS